MNRYQTKKEGRYLIMKTERQLLGSGINPIEKISDGVFKHGNHIIKGKVLNEPSPYVVKSLTNAYQDLIERYTI